jgi:hypothetical protein
VRNLCERANGGYKLPLCLIEEKGNMNRRIIAFSLSILIVLCLESCNSKPIVNETAILWPDSLTNELIRFAISKNKYQCKYFIDKAPLRNRYNTFSELKKTINVFTVQDSEIVNKQLEYDRKFEFKIDTLNFNEISFLSLDTLKSWGMGSQNPRFWEIYRKKVHQCFCTINCPIYNKDKSLAILTSAHTCGGLWIEWYEVLYKRMGESWQIIDTLSLGGS